MSLKSLRRVVLAALATCSLCLVGAGVALAEDPIKLPKPRPAAAATAPAKADKTAATKPADTAKTILPKPPAVPKDYGYGRVILLRGLANVFSRGMDKMAAELKLYGVPVTLENHSQWHRLADQIIADYKAKKAVLPIILVGHSLGADASLVMANWLAYNHVPVRLVVAFDGVADINPITNPTVEVINYFKPTGGYGKKVTAAPNFAGSLTNIDLSDRKDIGHLNIDKIGALQDETILKILDIMKKKPTVTAKN